MSNSHISGNTHIGAKLETSAFTERGLLQLVETSLTERLPPGWTIELQSDSNTADRGSDATALFRAPDGSTGQLELEVKRAIQPRSANELTNTSTPRLIVAPYLSPRVREILQTHELSFLDATGNVRLVLPSPGLFVLTEGATNNPWPTRRRHALRGLKAGRVVRGLCSILPPIGVRQIAEYTDTSPGYVSRLLAQMNTDALIERTEEGQVGEVHWRRLLAQWAEADPIERRSVATLWLDPRGPKHLQKRLEKCVFQYCITGSRAASRVAPIAPPALTTIYVDRQGAVAAEALGLHPATRGANVVLLEPHDRSIYNGGIQADDALVYAPFPLVVADLLGGPGRSPAEGETLMDWMADHQEVWRG